MTSISPHDLTEQLLRQLQNKERVKFSVRNNHAPMVLIAMLKLGATNDQLQQYFNQLPVEPLSATPDHNKSSSIQRSFWKDRLGDFSAVIDYILFFESVLKTEGRSQTLSEYLDELMPGVAAHAFHPLIRISYGLEIGNDSEIAFGLGYWAATYLPGPPVSVESPTSFSRELYKRMISTPELQSLRPEANSITARIQHVYDNPDFQRLLQPITVPEDNPLEVFAHQLAETFADDQHFAILHSVTSLHALKSILPFCKNIDHTITHYWIACLALLISNQNRANTAPSLSDNPPDWNTLFASTLETGIEHTIKLTHTCFQKSQDYSGNIWQRLAEREIKSPSPFI